MGSPLKMIWRKTFKVLRYFTISIRIMQKKRELHKLGMDSTRAGGGHGKQISRSILQDYNMLLFLTWLIVVRIQQAQKTL